MVVPFLYGKYLKILLGNKTRKAKSLVLTFDDGPGDRLTPAILEILKENKVKATFFLLGRNIAGREAIVRQIENEGHEICSHGYDHINYWKVLPSKPISDIKKGWQAIDKVLGVQNSAYPFRPPYGKLNIFSFLYLLINKVPIYYWTVVSGDTLSEDKRRIEFAAEQIRKRGGGVPLMHDFDRKNNKTDKFVIESLMKLLETAEKENFKVLTVSEIVGI